jgi:hypothetical protein
MVVDDIHNNYPNHSEYGSVIQDCKNILDLCNDFVVVFTRRQAHGNAHALARAVLSHASRSTFDVISNCIATIIINEMHYVVVYFFLCKKKVTVCEYFFFTMSLYKI